jgi:hypothetical protein
MIPCLESGYNKWQDKILNTAVLDRTGLPSINTLLMKSWAGHAVCMPDHRMPKIIFFSEMLFGERSRRGQMKRFNDTLKSSLKFFNIKTDSWEIAAQERASWCSCLYNGAVSYEAFLKSS